MFTALRDDVREGVRRAVRTPRLTLLAVVTLALGIGSATAVFTMAHTVLVAPPPFREPDRIVTLNGHTPRAGSSTLGVSYPDIVDYVRAGILDAACLAGYEELNWTGQSLPGFDGAEVLRGMAATPDYFRVFDQPMALGRGFAAGEGEWNKGRDVVVIAHSLWQRRFGARPDIIGQTMTLDGRIHTIVGVTRPEFLTYRSTVETLAWVAFVPPYPDSLRRDARGWRGYGRLAHGLSLEAARQRLDELNRRLARAFPDAFTGRYAGYSVAPAPLLAELHKKNRPAFLALAAAVLCVLLIAAANVASLLLAKATADAREMAVRAALGAARLRLFRMMLVQSLALALLAGLGGALIAVWLLDAARSLMPASLQFGWAFAIDDRVFIVAFLVSSAAGLLAGLAPALESLRLAAGSLRPRRSRSRILRAIVTAEVAVAVFLCVGAGLLGKSFIGLLNRPLGYQTENVLGMRVRLQGERYKTPQQIADYWAQLVDRAGGLPGVAKAASVSDLPMGWQFIGGDFEVQGRTTRSDEMAHYLSASPGYFATVGIPIVAGRGFTESDGREAEQVAIVNDFLAERFWPGQSAIGHQVKFDGPWRRIVGVVRRIRHAGPQDGYQHEIYIPVRQLTFNAETMFLVVRSSVPPDSLVAPIRGTVASIDPNVPAFEIRTLEQAFTRETATPRLPAALTAAFAALALVLAALGLFGVIAYWVSRRVKEMGVRAALGARPAELRRLVLRQGVRLTAVGLVVGVAGALAAMRLVRSLLYGMSERDPSIYVATIGVSVAMALAACWLPALRASRIDPAAALREE